MADISNGKWIDLATALGQMGYDIVDGCSADIKTITAIGEPKVISTMLMSRALSNFNGAVILLENDLVVEARILVRCCFENAVWVIALHAEGSEFAKKMLHADVSSKQARAELIFSRYGLQLPEATEEKIRTQTREMNKKYPKKKPLNPQDVAQAGQLRNGYLMYSQLSADAAHPSVEALYRHIAHPPGSQEIILDVDPAPKKVEVIQTWDWACYAMLFTCVGVNEILGGTPAGQKLNEMVDRYQALTHRKWPSI
jgi:uncharacterized protein DUF5677